MIFLLVAIVSQEEIWARSLDPEEPRPKTAFI
jgi:hypothetical protein